MGILCWLAARRCVCANICTSNGTYVPITCTIELAANLLPTTKGGEPKGKSVYALAEKRCANYKTCKNGFTGVSKVNDEMVKLYQEGQADIQNFQCAAAESKMERIKTLMTIPLVQGTLRYAYKSDPNALAGKLTSRNIW